MNRLLGRGRADDNEATIANRLAVYQTQTAPLIDFYRAQGKVHTVVGNGTIEETSAKITAILDTLKL